MCVYVKSKWKNLKISERTLEKGRKKLQYLCQINRSFEGEEENNSPDPRYNGVVKKEVIKF